MNPIFQAALEVETFLRSRGWRFCFIGGLAVQRWGEPRFTADVDLTLMTGFGNENPFIEGILRRFSARIEKAAEFADQSRVLLIAASNQIPIDISLGALPFENATVERASSWKIDAVTEITTCSAEDLIVHKCFANRDQDWLDVEGILAKQQGNLDGNLILEELVPLADLKDAPEIVLRLNELLGAR